MHVHEVSVERLLHDGVALRQGGVVVVLLSDRLDDADRRHVSDRLVNAVATVAPVTAAIAPSGFIAGIPAQHEATA